MITFFMKQEKRFLRIFRFITRKETSTAHFHNIYPLLTAGRHKDNIILIPRKETPPAHFHDSTNYLEGSGSYSYFTATCVSCTIPEREGQLDERAKKIHPHHPSFSSSGFVCVL
jgi:hypothetical protein